MIAPVESAVPDILGRRMQFSMVVRDIDAAAHYWAESLGVGPWVMFEDAVEGRRFEHRGHVTEPIISLAMAYGGDTQFELITQHNDAPSPYREFLDQGREGVQHLEFWPDDYVGSCTALTRAGFSEVMIIRNPDGSKNGSYFESPPLLGPMLAVVPMTPFRRSYMSAIERLAATWDGNRPVRKFARRADFLASEDFLSGQPVAR
jgi:hypothetical protein